MAKKKADGRSYGEKLRDPRWQAVRLRVLERAGFRCQWCGSKEKTLHVHHGSYEKGKEPWETHPTLLYALCEECHERAETQRQVAMRAIGFVPPWLLSVISSCARGLGRVGRFTFAVEDLPVADEEGDCDSDDSILMVRNTTDGRWISINGRHEEHIEVMQTEFWDDSDPLMNGTAWTDEAVGLIRAERRTAESA